MFKYCQKPLSSCGFSSLASYFVSIKKIKADNAISLRIEESLKSKLSNRIDIANTISKNENKSRRTESVLYPEEI